MADTFWVNNDGFILVDDNGRPYFGESCPCGVGCWQKYEASCIDHEGSPVYGSSGTGKTAEAHWGDPIMVEWKCAGTNLPGVPVTNAWVQVEPGYASMWKKVDLDEGTTKEQCSTHCSVPIAVAKPDLPCSCQALWSTINHRVIAPNYSYVVRRWKFLGWDVGPNGSTFVESAILPIWEYSKFATKYDKVTGSRYNSSKSWFYLGNYVIGSLDGPQAFCGDDAADKSAYKSAQDTWSYMVYSVTNAPGANGAYVRLPNESIWEQRDGSDSWIEDGKLYIVSSMYKDLDLDTSTTSCCVSELENATVNTSWVTYSRVHEMPFSTGFNSEQWGHLSVAVEVTDNHLHPFIIREARGAQVPKDEIDITKAQFVTGRYEGSPLWYYRTYVTTDWDIGQLNLDNWNYVMSGEGQNVSALSAYVRAPGVFCPQYWFLYITEAWQACTEDTDPRVIPFIEPGEGVPCAPGVECMPPTYMLNVAADGRRAILPYWSAYNNTSAETGWRHEVDESLDQNGEYQVVPGLRDLNTLTDEHAYKVSRLSIKNYPTWYGSDVKCANVLDGAAWEIPQMDLSDAAWFRRRGCYGIPEKREWPDVFDTRAYTSCSCAFSGIGSVTPIEVLINGRPQSWYYKTIGFQQNLYQQEDGGWVLPLNYVVQVGHGCPENTWSGMLFQTGYPVESCCVTSGGASEWIVTKGDTWIDVYRSYQGYDQRWDWGLPTGTFTWLGNVPNSVAYCQSYVPNNPVIYAMGNEGDYVTESSANHIKGGYRSDPGVWQFEIANNPCDPRECDESISAIAKYAIKYSIELIDKDHCPTCDILHDGDEITVLVSCSAGYIKKLQYLIEETDQNVRIQGEHHFPGWGTIDVTGEVSSGTLNADYMQTNMINVGYSVEWTAITTITWHTSMGSSFYVPLDNIAVTKTWLTDMHHEETLHYNLAEDVFSEVVDFSDEETHWTYYWGGRSYIHDHTSSEFTAMSPVVVVSSGVQSGVTVFVSTAGDGTCELAVTQPYFDHDDTYMADINTPGLPIDYGGLSSVWAPGNSPYTVYASGSVVYSYFYDSNGSDQGSKSWNTYVNSWDNSFTRGSYVMYEANFPTINQQNRDYLWEYNPERLYPCDYAGRDVLDEVPTLALSVGRIHERDCAQHTAYNSGSCYGRWERTDYPTQGETYFQSGRWDWEVEGNISCAVNPDIILGN